MKPADGKQKQLFLALGLTLAFLLHCCLICNGLSLTSFRLKQWQGDGGFIDVKAPEPLPEGEHIAPEFKRKLDEERKKQERKTTSAHP
jgi:hypothetical protein